MYVCIKLECGDSSRMNSPDACKILQTCSEKLFVLLEIQAYLKSYQLSKGASAETATVPLRGRICSGSQVT